jgi:hypothetical protein
VLRLGLLLFAFVSVVRLAATCVVSGEQIAGGATWNTRIPDTVVVGRGQSLSVRPTTAAPLTATDGVQGAWTAEAKTRVAGTGTASSSVAPTVTPIGSTLDRLMKVTSGN